MRCLRSTVTREINGIKGVHNVACLAGIAIEGDSVSIIGAQEQHDSASSSKKSGLGAGSGGGFYSVGGKEEKSSKENIVANVSSELSAGNDVSIKARESDVRASPFQVGSYPHELK